LRCRRCLSQLRFGMFEFIRRDFSRFEASLQRRKARCRAFQLSIRQVRLEPHDNRRTSGCRNQTVIPYLTTFFCQLGSDNCLSNID
jgi:hypothetical protein